MAEGCLACFCYASKHAHPDMPYCIIGNAGGESHAEEQMTITIKGIFHKHRNKTMG